MKRTDGSGKWRMMARKNGNPGAVAQPLDAEHELPASRDEGDEISEGVSERNAAAIPFAEDSEVQKLKAERDALTDRLARLQAEFENARKRTAREQQEFRDYAMADTIRTLLPVLDSLERALAAGSGSDVRSGVELIHRQLLDALQKSGLRPIPAIGEQFDPRLHEAIEAVETSDVPDHQVVEELQA
ncbi:MAG: nucleotide exchange factor GrpE, partial [Acidobacteriales bacterium]|nr:nucleotide exchange factor GrpE [Terriglobales bacterium]